MIFTIQVDIEMTNETFQSTDVQKFIKEMSKPYFKTILKKGYRNTVLGEKSKNIQIIYGIKQ
jgi:hypothetical protein